MSTVIIGGGPRPQAKVSTVNGVVTISDESGVIASGFYDEDDARRYLSSLNNVEPPHAEEEHHDDNGEA